MYIRLNNQKELIKKAVEKAGSYRKLTKLTLIPSSSLVRYYNLETIPEKRFEKIIEFLKIKKEKLKFKLLEDNWKHKIGGKNSVKSRIKNGSFKEQLENAQKSGALKLKEWHKINKKTNPEKYYLTQYSRFKKIGWYKYKTKNNELVRNILEKQTADNLFDKKISYEYEPLINMNKNYFFPDFLINENIIIECTMWKGETKAYKLKEKIKILNKKYKVFVLIPKKLEKYYKTLKKHLIFDINEVKFE